MMIFKKGYEGNLELTVELKGKHFDNYQFKEDLVKYIEMEVVKIIIKDRY